MKVLEADLTWRAGRFETGIQVEVLPDGTIGRVGPALSNQVERLRGEALLPGFVNAHSHAFQVGLRGKAETYGSFWSWREEMYRLAGSLDAEGFRRLTVRAFREMLASGITAVGEFHYLHHLEGSRGYELDRVVSEAAREAGIRLVLLDTCYLTGDVGKPLEKAQERFGSRSLEEFLESAERADAGGLVAHSVRAVPIDAIAKIHEEARRRRLPFHLHVEEQEKEIESSLAHYGKRPLALLLDRLEIGPETTAVHCTHSVEEDLRRFVEAGANVSLTPLTEANLADGLPPAVLSRPETHLSLGTDSNLRIDFTEEMRLLEYGQRLREERRGVFRDESGSVAARLFEIATRGGARSLGIQAGAIESGFFADFFTLDARDTPPEELMSAFVFGMGIQAIRRVAVSGRWIHNKSLDLNPIS
jgi:formimidoylglutamate deiminase